MGGLNDNQEEPSCFSDSPRSYICAGPLPGEGVAWKHKKCELRRRREAGEIENCLQDSHLIENCLQDSHLKATDDDSYKKGCETTARCQQGQESASECQRSTSAGRGQQT